MPHYKQIIMCLPKFPPSELVGMFRRHAKKIFEHGGILRSIENHGVRELPERTTRRFADREGKKTFLDARYVTVSMDISPAGLSDIEKMLTTEDGILRVFTHRQKTAADRLETKGFNQPYPDIPFPKF